MGLGNWPRAKQEHHLLWREEGGREDMLYWGKLELESMKFENTGTKVLCFVLETGSKAICFEEVEMRWAACGKW